MGRTGEFLGVLGFVISLGLACLRVWEALFRRARFKADFEWQGPRDNAVLEFTLTNVGWKKGSVRRVLFRTRFPKAASGSDPRQWLELDIQGPTLNPLPLVLDVDEASPVASLPLNVLRDGSGNLKRLMRDLLDGVALLVVTTARGKEIIFPVPAYPSRPQPFD